MQLQWGQCLEVSLKSKDFVLFHFSCVCTCVCTYMCTNQVYIFTCMSTYVGACVPVCMHVCVCGFMMHNAHVFTLPFYSLKQSLSQTQSSPVWLVVAANLLWVPLSIPPRTGITCRTQSLVIIYLGIQIQAFTLTKKMSHLPNPSGFKSWYWTHLLFVFSYYFCHDIRIRLRYGQLKSVSLVESKEEQDCWISVL